MHKSAAYAVCHACNHLEVEYSPKELEEAMKRHSLKSHKGERRFEPMVRISYEEALDIRRVAKRMPRFWDAFNRASQ